MIYICSRCSNYRTGLPIKVIYQPNGIVSGNINMITGRGGYDIYRHLRRYQLVLLTCCDATWPLLGRRTKKLYINERKSKHCQSWNPIVSQNSWLYPGVPSSPSSPHRREAFGCNICNGEFTLWLTQEETNKLLTIHLFPHSHSITKQVMQCYRDIILLCKCGVRCWNKYYKVEEAICGSWFSEWNV